MNESTGEMYRNTESVNLENLYLLARRAKEENNMENVEKYYGMILISDPKSWEANFYLEYAKAEQCRIIEICSATRRLYSCVESTFKLIKNNIIDVNEQLKAGLEVADKSLTLLWRLYVAAENHYLGINYDIRAQYRSEYLDRTEVIAVNLLFIESALEKDFGNNEEIIKKMLEIQKTALHIYYRCDNSYYSDRIEELESKIKKIQPDYEKPSYQSGRGAATSGGCYVATAVYGSYDCPQVWTLRRYRDNTLASTWYGRAFIRTYYAISPTLVKWFGHTEWFKKMWQGKLDRMVEKLQSEGVESTPYQDKNW